jgi:hypothetical protein
MRKRFRLAGWVALGLLGCVGEQAEPVGGRPEAGAVAPQAATVRAGGLVSGGLATGEVDVQGQPVVVRCATCHEGHPTPLPVSADKLGAPHAGLAFAHGELRCAACHDTQDREALHLADGRKLALSETTTLCSQCHGLQARDYVHGAHGGMRGYWDTKRGPRVRNPCVSCHDPHAPAYPQFLPMPAPRDRFAPGEATHE